MGERVYDTSRKDPPGPGNGRLLVVFSHAPFKTPATRETPGRDQGPKLGARNQTPRPKARRRKTQDARRKKRPMPKREWRQPQTTHGGNQKGKDARVGSYLARRGCQQTGWTNRRRQRPVRSRMGLTTRVVMVSQTDGQPTSTGVWSRGSHNIWVKEGNGRVFIPSASSYSTVEMDFSFIRIPK